jgi:hypothetical protein
MKTSNKLLAGIFLIIVILITVVQLMVYAKYKRGEVTAFKREQFVPMTSLPLPAVRFISLQGLGSCAVRPAGTLKLEIQQNNANVIQYHMVHDTLVVIGDASMADAEMEKGRRNFSLVNIYLPAAVQLQGVYCNLRVWGADDTAAAPSYTFNLQKNSNLNVNFKGADNAAVYFNQLNIHSERSTIDLNGHTVLNYLNLQLTDSKLNDNSATIREIIMAADDNSSISLSGKNINALK